MNINTCKLYLWLLMSLLFLSALPSAVRIPNIVDILPSYSYLLFSALRELNIIALFLLSLYGFTIFLLRKQSTFNAFLITITICLLIICLNALLFSSYGPLVALTGFRLFVLATIPFTIMLFSPSELSISTKPNIFIFFFYMIFCGISFLLNFGSASSDYGVTFLGPRFPFLYEGPLPACFAFGSFSCFILFCQYAYPNKRFRLTLCHIIVLFFNMFTGGRSGFIVSTICLTASIFLQLSPRFFNTFFSPRIYANRIVAILVAPSLVLSVFLLASNPLISGRASTAYQIERSGLIGGSFQSRITIFQRAVSNSDNSIFTLGTPGLGTNVSTQFKLIPIKYMNSDSFVTSSFLSFGLLGLILFLTLVYIFWKFSFSVVILLAFIAFLQQQVYLKIFYHGFKFA